MTGQNPSIDDLIAQLQTEEGKARALASTALKIGNIERAIEVYEQGKLPLMAAELAQKSGQLMRAASIYENAGFVRKAADIVFKLGLKEEA